MLKDNTIAIYIIVDDILQRTAYKEDVQRRVNDAMLLTTVLVSSWYFGGNWDAARGYMLQHHCQYMLDKSRFCRRVHSCRELAIWLFSILGWLSKQLNHRQRYILDTFPVAVCHNIRIKNCRLLKEEDFRGKSVSKREYFYGFKVALLIDEYGNPIELAMYAGGYSEQSALHRMSFDLPPGSIVWQDSGFTDYEWEDFYKENERIEFATQRKKNSHRGDTFIDEMAKKYNRKIVETAYSVITSRFPKRIHAVSIDGFQLKVFFVILAYSITKYL
jgi:hypothetical protein